MKIVEQHLKIEISLLELITTSIKCCFYHSQILQIILIFHRSLEINREI